MAEQRTEQRVPFGGPPTDASESSEKSKEMKNRPSGMKQEDPDDKRPSKLKQIWSKTGLDLPTFMMMIKYGSSGCYTCVSLLTGSARAAVAPTIAIAIYQSLPVAEEFTTLGYLVAIASILGFAIMPRAKFLQTSEQAHCKAAALDRY